MHDNIMVPLLISYHIHYTIASRCIHCIYYPRPKSSEICGQIYPKPKVGGIFDHKLLMTEVKGSMYSVCVNVPYRGYMVHNIMLYIVSFLLILATLLIFSSVDV